MGKRGKTRTELNIAIGLIGLAILCICATACYSQIEHLNPQSVQALSMMPSNSLLALIAILSLGLSAYLIRLLFGKLLAALEANTKASMDMAQMLAERPCIRRREND